MSELCREEAILFRFESLAASERLTTSLEEASEESRDSEALPLSDRDSPPTDPGRRKPSFGDARRHEPTTQPHDIIGGPTVKNCLVGDFVLHRCSRSPCKTEGEWQAVRSFPRSVRRSPTSFRTL